VRVRSAYLAALLLCGCALYHRPPPAPPRHTRLGLGLTTRTLPNGLRVVVVRDPAATEVQVTVRYQVGSVDDGDHPGIAHLAEHLMFQQELGSQPLFMTLEDAASYFNAATTFDATTYIARAPAAQLSTLMTIEATRLAQRCSTISAAAFEREREVVIHELEQTDQASRVFAALDGALYPHGHPYSVPIGGSVDSVAKITRDQACAFIDAHYGSGNAVLVLSGNLRDGDVDGALAKVGAVSRRDVIAAAPVAQVAIRPQHVETPAPIDDDVLVLAWPLPMDPQLQTKVRAIAAALPRLVDAEIKGAVIAIELGDSRAPMFGLAVVPADDETFQQAVDGTRRGIEKLPGVFTSNDPDNVDQVVFDRLRLSAVYGVYASLDDGSERDALLATDVIAGRDPVKALDAQLAGLLAMTRSEGATLAAQYLAANQPTVVTLKAVTGKKRGERVSLRAAVHDMGQRRAPVDPGLAHHVDSFAVQDVAGIEQRRLPNGLRVVLVPLSTVPTFDARLIFDSGAADEPPEQRGVALIAAHTLTWDLHYLNDLMRFVAAGGMRDTDVSTDRTSFSVQGLDMNLDVVLAGLRRWVLDGTYDDSAADYVAAMRRATKRVDDQGVLTDAWRTALFGQAHPYVAAGISRLASTTLTLLDADRFRTSHYTPANATLVVTGHFDAALANRWIDYLFSDWRGSAPARDSVPAHGQPTSIARIDDTALIQLRIAIPSAAERGHALVAAAMLDDIVHDVRYRMGASYTLDAQLAETRLARFYAISGWIDASRGATAMQMIRDRIDELRKNADAAARAFVVARRHVLAHLQSRVTSAGVLASRIEHDIEVQRAPLSDIATARIVQALTIDDMDATLAEVNIAQATVLLSGPAAETKATFDTLGRKASYIDAPTSPGDGTGPGAAPLAFAAAEQRVRAADVQPALTLQPPPPWMYQLAAGHRVGTTSLDTDFAASQTSTRITGNGISALAAYRLGPGITVGASFGIAVLDGTHTDSRGAQSDVSVVPIDVRGVVHFLSTNHMWLVPEVGIHAERYHSVATGWRMCPIVAVGLGFDFFHIGRNAVGVGGKYETSLGNQFDTSFLGVSVVVRR